MARKVKGSFNVEDELFVGSGVDNVSFLKTEDGVLSIVPPAHIFHSTALVTETSDFVLGIDYPQIKVYTPTDYSIIVPDSINYSEANINIISGMNMEINSDNNISGYDDGDLLAVLAHGRFFVSNYNTYLEEDLTIGNYTGGVIGATQVFSDVNASGGHLISFNLGFLSDVVFYGSETLGTHDSHNVLLSGTIETDGNDVTNGEVVNAVVFVPHDNPVFGSMFIVRGNEDNHVILDESPYPWTKRADNSKITMGAEDDVELYWDATDFVIDPTVVSGGGVKIPVGEDLHLKKSLFTIDLTSLVPDMFLYIPVIEGTAKDSLGALDLVYGVAFNDLFVLKDEGDRGFVELAFSKPDFILSARLGAISYHFAEERFEVGQGDLCPSSDDFGDEEYWDLGKENLKWGNLHLLGEVYGSNLNRYAEYTVDDNSTATTIVIAGAYQPVYPAGTQRLLSGFTFSSGVIQAIASASEIDENNVRFTSNAHGMSAGDMIVIRGTTSYNGYHIVTAVDTNTFDVAVTWVADEAGTLMKPDQFTVSSGTSGVKQNHFSLSGSSAGNSKDYEFTFLIYDAGTETFTECSKCHQLVRTQQATEYFNVSSGTLRDWSAGDKIALIVKGADTTAVTIKELDFCII